MTVLLAELEAMLIRRDVRIEKVSRVKPDRWIAVRDRGDSPTPDDCEEITAPVTYYVKVETLAEADGVQYLCPKCLTCNGGPIGTHSITNWFVGKVYDDETPTGGRWIPQGELENLTFIGPSSASVLLTGGCGAHFCIRNGMASPAGQIWKFGDPVARRSTPPAGTPRVPTQPRPRGRR